MRYWKTSFDTGTTLSSICQLNAFLLMRFMVEFPSLGFEKGTTTTTVFTLEDKLIERDVLHEDLNFENIFL